MKLPIIVQNVGLREGSRLVLLVVYYNCAQCDEIIRSFPTVISTALCSSLLSIYLFCTESKKWELK